MKKFVICLLTFTALLGLSSCGKDSSSDDTIKEAPRYENVSIFEASDQAGAVKVYIQAHDEDAQIYYIIVKKDTKNPTAKEIVELDTTSNTKIVSEIISDLEYNVDYDVFCVIEKDGVYSDVYKTTIYTNNEEDIIDKGEGTIEDPYRIYSVKDLENIGTTDESYSSHYIFMNDIDLTDTYGEGKKSFLPIGFQLGSRIDFSGTINGKGHTIKGMYIDESGSTKEGVGFVASLTEEGIVQNLVFVDPIVKGAVQRLGTIVGYNKGMVCNCAVINGYVEQTGGSARSGGAIGQSYTAGLIYGLYVDCEVVSNGEETGGIVGCTTSTAGSDSIVISNSYFVGSVKTAKKRAAGIIGKLESGIVESCYVMADIETQLDTASGIVGYSEYKFESAKTYIKNCFVVNTSMKATSNLGYILGASSTTSWEAANGEMMSKRCYVSGCFVVSSTLSGDAGKYDVNYNADTKEFTDLEHMDQSVLSDCDFMASTFYNDLNSANSLWVINEGAQRPVLKVFQHLDDGKL